VLLLLALLAAPAAAQVEVRATLEPEVIGLDETALLTIEVQGAGFARLRFEHDFEYENLEIVGGPFQYEDVRFGNGQLSRSFRLSWQLRPLATGPSRVHSLVIRLRGDTIRLADRQIRVQEEPAGLAGGSRRLRRSEDALAQDPFGQLFGRMPLPWRRDRPESPGAFLQAEVWPERPVVGQQVLYTVYLYTREDITSISPSGVPDFQGFWVRDIPLPQHLPTDMVEVDGRRYGRVPLLKKALFPLRPGRHVLEPTQMDLTLRLYERRFFGPPLSRSDQVRLKTEPETVDVRPLPPAPPGFGGAVGRLSVIARLEPREVRLGDSATLTVILSGQGNLHAAGEPEVGVPAGLALFPPQQGGRDHVDGNRIGGMRTWSYAVVPERAGEYTLELPGIPYFDPASGRYRVAAATPVSLTVLPRPAAAASAEGEPHGIRDGVPAPAGGRAGRWASLLPWLFALPWGLALVVTLARRRAEPAGAVPPQRRELSAERKLAERLSEVETEERPRQMAARLEEGWREFLAERWGVPPETPSSRWADLLALRKATAEAVAETARLVEDLHYLRYAPQLSATGTLRGEVLARCRRLLRRLR
jgi:hypothetical protein